MNTIAPTLDQILPLDKITSEFSGTGVIKCLEM